MIFGEISQEGVEQHASDPGTAVPGATAMRSSGAAHPRRRSARGGSISITSLSSGAEEPVFESQA